MKEKKFTPMTEEQIRVMAETMADVEGALDNIDPELAAQIRSDQEEVATITREAWSSGDKVVDLFVRGLARVRENESQSSS